jgi:hypothetical protein
MSTVFTGTVFNSLKLTLDKIVDDDTQGYENKADMKKWIHEQKMTDNWEDDLESAGPGLASEKGEGMEIPTGTITEGYITRYIARTFGLKLIITEEAMEDKKYPKIINAAQRLHRAMWKTADIDATNIPIRAFNTGYVGGDGQPLCSASHTLARGGTFSNVMATPLSPSRAAVIIAKTAINRMPGHDGIIEGYNPVKVIYPTDQWATWEGLLKSKYAPEAGEFNEINVVNSSNGSMDLTGVPLKYWTNTATNWIMLTDCDEKINFRWRRKPKSNSWVENSQELMQYSNTARWSRGWSEPRCAYGVNA